MELKHTPGPWRYWLQRRYPEDTCTFQNIAGYEVLRAVTVTVSEADARLIAAAPDLLEALQDALACFLSDHYHDHPTANAWRTVIAKATGSAQ